MNLLIKLLWAVVSALIIVLGLYFTFYLDFSQFKFHNYKACLFSKSNQKKGISPFNTLMLTLAGRIGVGSIAGIAFAIYVGGAGTIFWVWVISLLSLPLAFCETVLGSLYKKEFKGEYIGGPSYYIKYGLGKNGLAKLYAICILLSFLFGFLGIQVNTIVRASSSIFHISPLLIGICLAFFTFFVVIGDVFKISSITSKMVPFMLIFYFVLSIFLVFQNINMVYSVILLIFRSAFSFKPFFSGFLYSMIIGIQRGIFSSETGLGTGSITSSASNSFHFKNDGYLQMIGVSITTLVVCTITAFIILLSPYQNMNVIDVNGIEIASFAFSYHFSSFGSVLLFLFIFLCSFSTILTGYYDSLISLRFLAFHHNKILKKILIFCTMIMILLSSFLSSFFMWQMVDLFTGILILINLYAIWEMKEKVKNILKYHS